jgi:hypothetical protein
MSTSTSDALRESILSSIPVDPFQTGDPDPRYVYLPRTHVRALDPDNMLVVGARGTGKSFWWHALLSSPARAALAPHAPSMQRGTLEVAAGWSALGSAEFPDKDTLAALRTAGFDPRLIWKSVLIRQLAPELLHAMATWNDRIQWVVANPEPIATAFLACDTALAAKNARYLILFDALDRTADAYSDRRALLKGLLQLVLELRSCRAIRAKVFVRDDMVQDAEVLAFADASKVMASRVDLTWPRNELYGLLWQYMGNAESRTAKLAFLNIFKGWTNEGGIYRMPDPLRASETAQRQVFAEIAGKAMGTNERRGLPYTWIPTHLGDANAVATPRSFLAAIRTAASETASGAPRALEWRSIHIGVQKASQIRVIELAEDFPWTKPAMEALEGLNVPCDRADLEGRWGRENVLTMIRNEPEGRINKGAKAGLAGLLRDLVDVGVLELRSDGRYNIPDVYRVGFRLKRRGGVRPVT